jgi:hypothetical protein
VVACAVHGAKVAAGQQRSADSSALRWWRPRSCRARDASVRAPARGVAHGVAAACAARGGREGRWQRSAGTATRRRAWSQLRLCPNTRGALSI